MARYGVSRTVVREAISHLQAAGLVHTRHGIGTFVQSPSSAGLGMGADMAVTVIDVLSILELRICLESEAAALAAERRSVEQLRMMASALGDMQRALEAGNSSTEADRRFHSLIAEATGNPYYVDMISRIGTALIPRSQLNTPGLSGESASVYLERMTREHDDIYRYIDSQDPESARAAARLHLYNSRERLRMAQQQMTPI